MIWASVNQERREDIMNRDQVKGRIKEAKGNAKKVAGIAVGSKKLERKGIIQNTIGKVQSAYGDLKEDIRKA